VLAADGERDPQRLRSLLLAEMPLGEPETMAA
jgi:hypothetical protein